MNKKNDRTFSWTDKEVELLLESIKIFKVNMETERVDWQSLTTIYDKIMERVLENYLKTSDIEEFSHGECIQELLKARITSKIKKIRFDYKKAVDLGKRCGGRRIIMTFMTYFRTYGQAPQLLKFYPLDLIYLYPLDLIYQWC